MFVIEGCGGQKESGLKQETTLTQETVETIPVSGRNVNNVMTLIPGVAAGGSTYGTASGEQAGGVGGPSRHGREDQPLVRPVTLRPRGLLRPRHRRPDRGRASVLL